MIIIVGADSPIGIEMAKKLNQNGFNYLTLVSADFSEKNFKNQELKSWYQLSENELLPWLRKNREEIEFILWCKISSSDQDKLLLNELWTIGHHEQIPIVATIDDESLTIQNFPEATAPFFWTIVRIKGLLASEENDHSILLETNSQQKEMFITFLPNVTNIVYFFMHHRKDSGSYLIPYQLIQLDAINESRSINPSNSRIYPPDSQAAKGKLLEVGYPY